MKYISNSFLSSSNKIILLNQNLVFSYFHRVCRDMLLFIVQPTTSSWPHTSKHHGLISGGFSCVQYFEYNMCDLSAFLVYCAIFLGDILLWAMCSLFGSLFLSIHSAIYMCLCVCNIYIIYIYIYYTHFYLYIYIYYTHTIFYLYI